MNFRNLDVYQFAVRFLPLAGAIADSLPPRYAALGDQLRRASLSIPLNSAVSMPWRVAVPWNALQSWMPAEP
jgi:hypothetical protein